jgi:hypothetical protein
MGVGREANRLVFVPCCLVITLLLGARAAMLAQQRPETLARETSNAWLELVDSGKYGQSWQEASGLFKAAVTKQQWRSELHGSRDPLGKLVSRKVKSAIYSKTLPGAPDGEYVVVQYGSAFENKPSALETVTVMTDKDGIWRVSDYRIK